jgi:predicted phosphoribosyltransferase
MFRGREDAGSQLAQRLGDRSFRDPLVLAIPRGGIVIGAVLARELGAELDVVLSRKLRAPEQPELAIGALSENGEVHINTRAADALGLDADYLEQERIEQLAEIARRAKLFREIRPAASLAGRSVIVTDDGIATGSTIIAALKVARAQHPHELIVAVPVASSDRLEEVRQCCDEVVCLLTPERFWAIGQFYLDFSQLADEEVVQLLKASVRTAG